MSLLRFGLGSMRAVFLKRAGWRELTEAVANHVFGNEHGIENLAIVHVESQTDKIGGDHRPSGPGLDRGFGLGVLGLLDFFEQVAVDERTFFDGSSHKLQILHWAAVATDENKAIGMFLLVTSAVAFGQQAPW